MDVDNSDFDLINQFSSMQTNDKECLIEEFRRLSNTHLSNEGCQFYLDMANWNLNTALWTYYEFDSQNNVIVPGMKFICDITIRDGETVTPNTRFIKKWRVKNCGNIRWPPGSSIRLISGAVLSQKEIILVDTLNPDQETDIAVEMISPKEPAIIQCQYRLFTATGTPFGDPLWLFLNVEDDNGIMGITEQLNSVNMFNSEANSIERRENNNNNNYSVNNNNNNRNLNDGNNNSVVFKYDNSNQQQHQIIEATSMSFFQNQASSNVNTTNTTEDDKKSSSSSNGLNFPPYDEMFS